MLDGLGQGKIGPNALRPPVKTETAYRVDRGEGGGMVWIEYRRPGTAADTAPGWRFEVGDHEVRLISQWSEAEKPAPLLLNFDPQRCHVALLGLMNEDGSVRLPAVLHVPNQGSLRITSPAKRPVALGYDAASGRPGRSQLRQGDVSRRHRGQPRLEYRWEITAIYPSLSRTGRDPRLVGFQRNWLNILQPSPRARLLCQQHRQRSVRDLHV